MNPLLPYGRCLWMALSVCFFISFFIPPVQAQIKFYANSESHRVTGICLGCQIKDADKAVGSNENDYSTLSIGLSVLAEVEQTLDFQRALEPGRVVIGIGTGQPQLSIRLLGGIRVESLLGNTPNGDLKLINTNLLSLWQDSTKALLTFTPSKRYDRIRISLDGGLAGVNASMRVYYASQLPMDCGIAPYPLYYFPFNGYPNDVIAGLEVVSDSTILYQEAFCGKGISGRPDHRDSLASDVIGASASSRAKSISFWARVDTSSSDDPEFPTPYVAISAFNMTILLMDKLIIHEVGNDGLIYLSDNSFDGDAKPAAFNHFVVTFDNEELNLSINGIQRSSHISNVFMEIGIPDIMISLRSGQLDELLIYDRILSAAEIQSLWCSYGKDSSCLPNRAATEKSAEKRMPGREQLIIYPNPTTGQFNIGGNIPLEGTRITVRNILGREVFNSRLYSKTIVLPASLPDGVYYLILQTKDNNIHTQKIVLSR